MNNTISTNYRVIGQGKTYEGSCAVPESVWRHSSDEFPQEPFIPKIGICQDPVLSHIKDELKIRERILLYDFYPTDKDDQLLYLGYEVLEEEE